MAASQDLIANYLASGKSFTDTTEQAHRQFMRNAVKRARISKNKRDVALVLLNIWFNKSDKGGMHPGRKKVAKAAGVSVRTVATIFGELRGAKVLNVVSHAKGGRGYATVYTINMRNMLIWMGYKLPDTQPGDLVEVPQNVTSIRTFEETQKRAKLHTKKRARIAHRLKGKCTHLSGIGFEDPSQEIGMGSVVQTDTVH